MCVSILHAWWRRHVFSFGLRLHLKVDAMYWFPRAILPSEHQAVAGVSGTSNVTRHPAASDSACVIERGNLAYNLLPCFSRPSDESLRSLKGYRFRRCGSVHVDVGALRSDDAYCNASLSYIITARMRGLHISSDKAIFPVGHALRLCAAIAL